MAAVPAALLVAAPAATQAWVRIGELQPLMLLTAA
jgi:hypothetical protein